MNRPIDEAEPRTTQTVLGVVNESTIDKIDLLLVIDNSGSMGDKQDILASAVPQLVKRLVTPICVVPETGQPPEPVVFSDNRGECPSGLFPEFRPIQDINVGIVSSSIGSVGSATCTTPTSNDRAHLLHRSDPTAVDDVPTHEGIGYLAWDPQGKRPCPGEPPGGDVCPGLDDPEVFIERLTTMVTGVGEDGCGYEAPLEAAYRFLVDPAPYATLVNDGGVKIEGIDEDLLAQRKAFLRPDSLVAVLVLTDENDCSFRADNVGAYAANGGLGMPRPRRECASNPDDPCCASCWDPVPDGCPVDETCGRPNDKFDPANLFPVPVSEGDDENESNTNIRCWDQKRRFGTDFLYPIARYVNAFGATRIDPARLDLEDAGEGIDNPLFVDPESGVARGESLVYFAGLVGVPWQLVARKDESGFPSLDRGLDPSGLAVGGFRTADEMKADDVWRFLVADSPVDQPDSTLMIESVRERSTDEEEKKINGGEWDTNYRDLQYACRFELETACETSCVDCKPNSENRNPLCDPEDTSRQIHAKGYPGSRVLQVLRGLDDQGITASICPDETDQANKDAKNYGYNPAVFAIVERLKDALQASCQPRRLLVNEATGDAPCIVIEASDSDGDGDKRTTASCDALCGEPGRDPIDAETEAAADAVREILDREDNAAANALDCVCAITQLTGKPSDDDWESSTRYQCQYDQFPAEEVDGWCYVDATTLPPVGNPDLKEIAKCDETERRLVRFVGNGKVKSGGRQYITCVGDVAPVED